MSGFIDSTAAPAACLFNGIAQRGSSTRVWRGQASPDQDLVERARALASTLPDVVGRVLGAGKYADRTVVEGLQRVLPPALGAALRTDLEWYGCRGAGFHTDAHYAELLFGAWYIDGPPCDIVFARLDVRIASEPGTLIVFDPFEPHAVLAPGARRFEADRYVQAAPSVFLAFEISLTPEVREQFAIAAPEAMAVRLSSRVAVNAETGALHL